MVVTSERSPEHANFGGTCEDIKESWGKMSKSKHNGVDPHNVIE